MLETESKKISRRNAGHLRKDRQRLGMCFGVLDQKVPGATVLIITGLTSPSLRA